MIYLSNTNITSRIFIKCENLFLVLAINSVKTLFTFDYKYLSVCVNFCGGSLAKVCTLTALYCLLLNIYVYLGGTITVWCTQSLVIWLAIHLNCGLDADNWASSFCSYIPTLHSNKDEDDVIRDLFPAFCSLMVVFGVCIMSFKSLLTLSLVDVDEGNLDLLRYFFNEGGNN